MRTFIAVLFLAVPVVACPTGTIAMAGVCAAMPAPKDTVAVAEIRPSDEKPSRHPEPAWQRGEVKADMPVSTAGADDIADRQKADAIIEGKKKAGIK